MNKRILAFAMSCLMIFAMVGCSKAANQSEGSKDKDLEEVNVVFDWYPNAVHGFIYEAST